MSWYLLANRAARYGEMLSGNFHHRLASGLPQLPQLPQNTCGLVISLFQDKPMARVG